MTPETAETTALKALAWLVADQELLPVFLGASGASVEDLRMQASDPEFLSSVLDFLLMDDRWVVSVCDGIKLPHDHLMRARQALPGGCVQNWT